MKKKLDEAQWREVFRIRCRSKRGERLELVEQKLVEAAYRSDPKRYDAMTLDVFNATLPAGAWP